MPTPTHLRSLEEVDISRLAPYVRKINFVAPLRSWTIGYDTFEEIVVAQATTLKNSTDNCSVNTEEDGCQHYRHRHCNGESPFSEEQIQAGFQAYRTEAEAVENLLHSNELRSAWTRALQTLGRARSFRFSTSEWDEDERHLPVQPACMVRSHNHHGLHAQETCGRALAVVGDAVFAAGIACLSEAGIKVEALKVACVMTSAFGWEELPGWKSLNLTSMRSLKFQPWTGESNGHYVGYCESFSHRPGGQYPHARRANEAVSSIMKKSANNLEYFRWEGGQNPMRWPGEDIVSLPRLLHLELNGGDIEAINFQEWMAGMPSLQELYLASVGVTQPWSGWLNIFDSIRYHPKAMHVIFDQVHHCDWTELSVDHHTDDYEKYLEMEEGEDWVEDNDRSLALYLSGKGGYNRILRDMLGDDPEDEEEEGEWEEEEEEEGEEEEDEEGEKIIQKVINHMSDQ